MQMGIDQKENRAKGKVYSESKKSKSRKKQKKTPVVQKLYETCRDVFGDSVPGVVPSPEKLDRLKALLDNMTGKDVGLGQYLPFSRAKTTEKTPRITYLHIYECDKFSIGIFCLPPSGVIPLHNHPQMTVFSKLLFGTMHIKSYDWADDSGTTTTTTTTTTTDTSSSSDGNKADLPPVPSAARLAKVKADADFTAPCDTSILYPTDGGNMHCFTALTPCVVLDVLGPPYSDSEGRSCQYYLELGSPFSKSSGEGKDKEGMYAWLQEREKPEDLTIIGSLYNGPKLVTT